MGSVSESLLGGLESGDFDWFIENSEQYKNYYNSLFKIQKEVEKYCKNNNINPEIIYDKL